MPTARPDLRVEALERARHDRAGFTCGNVELDQYLQLYALQDVRRKANAIFVLVAQAAPRTILGYFTLCAYALSPGAIPETVRKHLSRYPLVSATLIGRLAIAQFHQGRGLGGVLLSSALEKALASADSVGSSMVVVDAIDAAAERFYAAHGFVQLPESTRLILPMRVVANLLAP